jgi:hypothetical protein
MSRISCALLGLMMIAMVGCSKTSKESAEPQPSGIQQPAVPPPPPAVVPPQPAPEANPQVVAPEPARPAAIPSEPMLPARKAQSIRTKPKPAARSISTAAAEPDTQSYKRQAAPVEHPAAPVVQQVAEAPAPPRPLEPRYATIPNGTGMQVRLQDRLDSALNITGDSFRAILDRDIEVDGIIVAVRGSVVEGRISSVERSGRVQGRAAMTLQLFSILIENQEYPLQTEILSFKAESTKKKDAAKVGIGAGLGAVIGAIAGGGKGAAIGAAVGAGAGGATVAASRGEEVKFEAEHKFNFVLQRDVRVKIE